jgi:23S rRNA (pseudouridine1915-N3)-methyltransferase
MLKCDLICIGKLKEEYWKKAFWEYEKRLQPFCRFTVTELPESRLPDHPSQSQISTALNAEADRILSSAEGSLPIALCIEGKPVSSEHLAELIRESVLGGTSKISFIIGSSYGLSDRVKQKVFLQLSMSVMTFPHQLARVMLIEQIYRSFQIIHNGKYHK